MSVDGKDLLNFHFKKEESEQDIEYDDYDDYDDIEKYQDEYALDYYDNPTNKAQYISSQSLMKQMNSQYKSNPNNINKQQFNISKKDKLMRLNSKINTDKLSVKVLNMVKGTEQKLNKERNRNKDKHDRATTEQVLDERTRLMLLKLINANYFDQINGCISTGKEANVYHATLLDKNNNNNIDRAIKIYKTSILVFKDRDRYVSGEYRWRNGYNKSNPRKMVKLWAEKEMRNLKRLYNANIPCPEPYIVRNHVLVMEFLGQDGWAAPRLKDANLSNKRLRACYVQCIKLMRTMFITCKLVHADLSEYNMLYFKRSLWIIDVSQSVEHDHPRAHIFLKMDCTNITKYFASNNVNVISIRDLYDFITHPSLADDEIDDYLQQKQLDNVNQGYKNTIEDQIYLDTYKITSLNDLDMAKIDLLQQQSEAVNYAVNLMIKQKDDDKHKSNRTKMHENIAGLLLPQMDSQIKKPQVIQEEEEEEEEGFGGQLGGEEVLEQQQEGEEALEEEVSRRRSFRRRSC